MSGLAVQRPSAIARFPPEEVQDWLDQLQRKIQRGLHPQPEPEPSPEPDSPNNDGRSQAGSPASVDSPRQAQKAVTDNRDVFMAEQPEAEATPRDENDDAGTDGEDHVYEGSAADEELDSSSSAVLYESDDQGEEGEGDEEEEESYGYDGGEVIPVDDVDYLESDGDNAEENENGVEEIEDEDIEDMEYDGDEQEYPEEEDDEDEEAYDQRSPDDGQGEIGSLDAMQHESEDDFYGNDDPDVQGSDVLEDQPYADGDERYSAEPEQPETWAPVDETAGVFAENPAYGWGAAPQPMMGPAHAPDAIDTARPVADQWTQSSPLSAQIPNDLDIQTAPNLYPSLPRQPEEPVQTSGLYPPLPAFSTDPATEAPLEEQNVQPLLPDTQLDPALIDPSLLEFMAQHLEAASSVGTPIPPSIYQNPRGGYQVLRANEWPVTATAFSYGDLSGQDGGMDRLEDLSGEDDPNAESAVDDGVKEGDEEMSNQTDEASDDEEDANLLDEPLGDLYGQGSRSPEVIEVSSDDDDQDDGDEDDEDEAAGSDSETADRDSHPEQDDDELPATRPGSAEVAESLHERGHQEDEEEDELIDDDEREAPEGGFSRETTAEASEEEETLPVLLRTGSLSSPTAQRRTALPEIEPARYEQGTPTSPYELSDSDSEQPEEPASAGDLESQQEAVIDDEEPTPPPLRATGETEHAAMAIEANVSRPMPEDTMLQSEVPSAVPPLVIDDTGSGIPSPRDDADDPMGGPAEMLPSDVFGAIDEAYRFIDGESQPSTPAAIQINDPPAMQPPVRDDRPPSINAQRVDVVVDIRPDVATDLVDIPPATDAEAMAAAAEFLVSPMIETPGFEFRQQQASFVGPDVVIREASEEVEMISSVQESATPLEIAIVELPNPHEAPPATNMVTPIEAQDRPEVEQTASLIVETPAAAPNPETVEVSAIRADSPTELPNPYLAAPETTRPTPLSPHDLTPHLPRTDSLVAEAPADAAPLTEVQMTDVTTSPRPVLPDPSLPPPDALNLGPIDPHDLQPRPSPSPSLVVEPPVVIPDLPETRDATREPTPVSFPAPNEPVPNTDLPAPITPHQLEPQSTPSASIIAHDPEGQLSGVASLVEGEATTSLEDDAATASIGEQPAELEQQEILVAGESHDLSMDDSDEEGIDQELADPMDTETEVMAVQAKNDTEDLAADQPTIGGESRHRTPSPGPRLRHRHRASEAPDTPARRVTRTRASQPEPGNPHVTRSHCYYRKMRIASDEISAVVLAPQCVFADVEKLEEANAKDVGPASEEEEREAHSYPITEEQPWIHARLAAQLHQVVGPKIYHEGHCYMLSASQGGRAEDLDEDEVIAPQSQANAHSSTSQASTATERTGSATSDTGLRRSTRHKSRALSVAPQNDATADVPPPRTPGRSTRRSARHMRSVSAVQDPPVKEQEELPVVQDDSVEGAVTPSQTQAQSDEAAVDVDENRQTTPSPSRPTTEAKSPAIRFIDTPSRRARRSDVPQPDGNDLAQSVPESPSRRGRRRRSRSRALEEAAYRPSEAELEVEKQEAREDTIEVTPLEDEPSAKPTSKGKGKATASPVKPVSGSGRTTRSRASLAQQQDDAPYRPAEDDDDDGEGVQDSGTHDANGSPPRSAKTMEMVVELPRAARTRKRKAGRAEEADTATEVPEEASAAKIVTRSSKRRALEQEGSAEPVASEVGKDDDDDAAETAGSQEQADSEVQPAQAPVEKKKSWGWFGFFR